MDDLVQRLRLLGNFGHDNHSTAHDAADAIERLTAECDALQAKLDAAALAERERAACIAEGFDVCDTKYIAAAIRAEGAGVTTPARGGRCG